MTPFSPQLRAPQLRVPATYMRGGTSKGVFFRIQDLPPAMQQPGAARDNFLLRLIGSPDPYGKQTDGMGGATSSTSKTVLLSKSTRPGHDVDYLFGQVAIDKAFVDWGGNCGNLSAAVGPYAIANGLVDRERVPQNGIATVRIWQVNIQKTIIAHVQITNGVVQETGDFELDGVTFPAAEVQLEFMDPAAEEEGAGDANGASGALFPTGNLIDELDVPAWPGATPGATNSSGAFKGGKLKATMLTAGIPTIFVNAADLGFTGTELQDDINSNPAHLAMMEAIRTAGALRMGLIKKPEEIAKHQHVPKVAWAAAPLSYTASSGKAINAGEIDVLVRAMSMGKLHHAMMGTAAVAIAVGACVPGTLVNLAAGGGAKSAVRFGHPSGTLRVGAEAAQENGQWAVKKAVMSRSARVLMEGYVRVPV